jgi:hypothetical protein
VTTALAPALDRKRLATLTARGALAGLFLCCIDSDVVPALYIVSHRALTREFPNTDDVERWLDLVTEKKS